MTDPHPPIRGRGARGEDASRASDEEEGFRRILDTVHKMKGFDGLQYKANYVKRRIAVRMRATKAATYQEYLKLLVRHPEEAGHLLDRLTIHVTEFFRDPGVYEALREKVLPGLLEGATGGRLKVWSAACSTGEEPYSTAFLLGDLGVPFEILATDVDAASVQTARLGEYPPESAGKLPKKTVGGMFRLEGGKYKVVPELRRGVKFSRMDVLGDWPPDLFGFQLILCRNLLIYLTAPQQQILYERFSRALAPGGILVLGLTETLMGPSREFFECIDIRNRIYRLR